MTGEFVEPSGKGSPVEQEDVLGRLARVCPKADASQENQDDDGHFLEEPEHSSGDELHASLDVAPALQQEVTANDYHDQLEHRVAISP